MADRATLLLAESMCVTSHHGLTRTDWPCQYHIERATNTLRDMRQREQIAARTERPDAD